MYFYDAKDVKTILSVCIIASTRMNNSIFEVKSLAEERLLHTGWKGLNKLISLDFSRPGNATDNPYIESFNGSFRGECLNVNLFMSFEDAEDKIEDWRHEYNHFGPHISLNNLTPME